MSLLSADRAKVMKRPIKSYAPIANLLVKDKVLEEETGKKIYVTFCQRKMRPSKNIQ